MPSAEPLKSVEEIAAASGLYPAEAFVFVQQSLGVVAERVHAASPKGASKHVSGQQLAMGLRDVAIERWGSLAGLVLNRWGILSTLDFGRIVYAMIEAHYMAKTAEDSLEDFRGVYEFRAAFDQGYRIPAAVQK